MFTCKPRNFINEHFYYACVFVEGMYTCKTGNFGNNPLCLCLCRFCRVCTHVRLVILEMRLFVYVCVVVKGMYTCKTGNFGNENLCLCLCCCREYLQM